jgi:hypothetical protein
VCSRALSICESLNNLNALYTTIYLRARRTVQQLSDRCPPPVVTRLRGGSLLWGVHPFIIGSRALDEIAVGLVQVHPLLEVVHESRGQAACARMAPQALTGSAAEEWQRSPVLCDGLDHVGAVQVLRREIRRLDLGLGLRILQRRHAGGRSRRALCVDGGHHGVPAADPAIQGASFDRNVGYCSTTKLVTAAAAPPCTSVCRKYSRSGTFWQPNPCLRAESVVFRQISQAKLRNSYSLGNLRQTWPQNRNLAFWQWQREWRHAS